MLKSLFLAAAALAATGAGATVQTVRFAIAASGFTDDNGLGQTPPVSTATGEFTITFDDAADIARQTTGITVTGFNVPYVGTLGFSYSKFFDGLSVGTDTQPGGYQFNNNGVGFYVDQPVADPNGSPLDFTYSNNVTSFSAARFTVTPLAAPSVPEPAAWATFVLGFALLGTALRRAPMKPVRLRHVR